MIFLTSIPKAGTHLVASVIQELVGAYPASVKKAGVMHSSAYDKYRAHAWLVGHFRDHQLKANDGLLELFTSRKVVVLIRDPRDVCKSMIHYLLSSEEPRQRRLADLIRELPFRDQLMRVADGIALDDRTFEVLRLEDHCDGFLGVKALIPHACVVRYEDFFTDVAAKQLSAYLGYSRKVVAQAILKARGGRSPTMRQGVPYEWTRSFDDELKAYFDTAHAEVLNKLGYPLCSEFGPSPRKLSARDVAARVKAPPLACSVESAASSRPAVVVPETARPSAPSESAVAPAVEPDGSSAAPQSEPAMTPPREPVAPLEVCVADDARAQSLTVADVQRLRRLEQENARLKRLLANSMLEIDSLRELLGHPTDTLLS